MNYANNLRFWITNNIVNSVVHIILLSQTEVHDGHELEFTVFHDCALPPDDFVANCRIQFEDLKIGTKNDVWVWTEMLL